MIAPIALQLYSVRDALAADFGGVIRKVAGMGYVGVETAQFPDGITPAAAARIIREAGLQIPADHSPLPLAEKRNEVLDRAAALGCTYLICPWLDPKTYFQDEDGVKRACDMLNEANHIARQQGLTFGYHNHDFEYAKLPGSERRPYEIMLERLDPSIILEIDTYWVKVGGGDPVAVVRSLGERAPLLHIKDGPATREAPMVAVGEGVMDVPAVIGAGKARWLIVELDRCATDMLEAVEKSARYLTGEKLAHGR